MHRSERLFRNVSPDVNRISQQVQDIVEPNYQLSTLPCFNNLLIPHPPEQDMNSPPGFLGVHLGSTHSDFLQHIIIEFDAAC